MSERISLWVLLGTATTQMIDNETPFVWVCVCSIAGCYFSELNFRWDSPNVVILLYMDKNIISWCWLHIMIILHVHRGLITLKGHSKNVQFYHRTTNVSSCKRVGSQQAGCRNVHQTCWAWLESSFHYCKICSMYFPKVFEPTSQLQIICKNGSFVALPGQDLHILHLLSETATWPADATAGCKTKDFKLLENTSGKSVCW